MSELLSSITGGGGGVFITKTMGVHTNVAIGASGTFITLTPPTGQRVMLEVLVVAGSSVEPDITVSVGGSDVISGGTLDDSSGTPNVGSFCIGVRTGGIGDRIELFGGIDEAITVTKDTGTTGGAIQYSYRYGN